MTRPKGTTPAHTRLFDKFKINNTTDCWEWTGGTNNLGYGMIRDGDKMRTAHRVSYEFHNDTTIPKYMCVCHTCDNPLCINPQHLWLGTRKDNMHDMIKKGRSKYHTRIGKKNKRLMCPHCKRDVANNTFTRWHGEKCKHKKTE